MSAFGTFLIALFAFIGTIVIIENPAKKLSKLINSNSSEELENLSEEEYEKFFINKTKTGCASVILGSYGILFKLFIEPIIIISVLINHTSYNIYISYLAYTMLVIVLLYWIFMVRIIKEKEPIKKPNRFFQFIKNFLFALPTCFLWLVFLSQINVIDPLVNLITKLFS